MHKTGDIFETYENMRHKSDVVFTGRVSTKELHDIFGGALALTFVPFFEGFGIPIVEAMSAGIPVICSNTTSMPEVGGSAVLYADPIKIDHRITSYNVCYTKLLRSFRIDRASSTCAGDTTRANPTPQPVDKSHRPDCPFQSAHG